MSSSYYTYTVNWNVYFTNVSVTMQLPSSKIKVSLARIIKKFTIMSHPSHTGLFSYVCLQLGFKCCMYRSASFPGPTQLFILCSYKRSAVAQGLKSSQIHGSIRISVKPRRKSKIAYARLLDLVTCGGEPSLKLREPNFEDASQWSR